MASPSPATSSAKPGTESLGLDNRGKWTRAITFYCLLSISYNNNNKCTVKISVLMRSTNARQHQYYTHDNTSNDAMKGINVHHRRKVFQMLCNPSTIVMFVFHIIYSIIYFSTFIQYSVIIIAC